MNIPLEQFEDDAQFEMTPMIDMVFLLLVFFMCASHLSTVQNVELEIPTATKAVVPKDRPDRLTVNVTIDGTIVSDNQPLTVDDLRTLVRNHKEANPNLKLYLRADQQTAHRHVKRVMSVMAELGVDDFIFGAFIPDNSP